MTNTEIDEKIAKLEKAISSPATPDTQKENFKNIIEKLKAAKTSEKPTESKATIYEALLDLADTDAAAAKKAWDAYSKEEKEAFKTWVNEGDAASEGIFKGFLYQLKHAPKTEDKKTQPKRVKTGPEDVKVKKVPVKFNIGEQVHIKSLMTFGIVESSEFDNELKQNRYTIKLKEGGKESVLEPDLNREKVKKDKKSPQNKSGFTKEQYKKFLQEYDNVGAQYEDAEGDKEKQAEIKLKMDALENKIHAYERDYQYNETISQGDYVKWKGKDGAFYVSGIHEGQATLKKVGDSKMSYSAPTKDLTIVQESTEKRAAKTEPVKPVEPAAPKKDPYDCEDLIATEKARIRKLKELAKERADAPKHTPATKNKLAIEKVGDRVVTNLNKRIEKGDVKRPELERLIKTTEDVLSSLKAALKKL